MGAFYSSSTQSSQSTFLIGKLNGKPYDEIQFYLLSHNYLDQDEDKEDKSDKNVNNQKKEIRKSLTSQIFEPLPCKKKLFCLQTYVQWKANLDFEFLKQIFIAPKRTIYLVQINDFPDFVNSFRISINSQSLTLFQLIQEFLNVYYMGMDVQWMENLQLENTDWTITERRHSKTEQTQYLATDFFKPLGSMKPLDGYCIMGLTWTDLYPAEKYNFALGEASYKHSSGVFSFGRFPPSKFDPTNPKDIEEVTTDVLWQLLKVSSHELGHLFGLEHCEFFSCHMNESLSMADAMNQPLFYCPVCLRKVQHICKFNLSERYKELENFIAEINWQFPSEKWLQSLQWLKKCRDFLFNEAEP